MTLRAPSCGLSAAASAGSSGWMAGAEGRRGSRKGHPPALVGHRRRSHRLHNMPGEYDFNAPCLQQREECQH